MYMVIYLCKFIKLYSMKCIVLFFIFLSFHSLNAQEKLNGIYLTDPLSFYYVRICGDKFDLIRADMHASNDTLAQCTFEWIDEHFIKLNTTELPFNKINLGVQVLQVFDSLLPIDKINVQFDFPISRYSDFKLKIKVYDNEKYLKPQIINYPEINAVVLPKKTAVIHWVIEQYDAITHVDFDNKGRLSYGLQSFESNIYSIDHDVNYIKVYTPLNQSYFERYFVSNEFARIVNDTIIWKNFIFIKTPINECPNVLNIMESDNLY